MKRPDLELNLSFLVVLFLSLVYVVYEVVATPSGGHPFGHALGVLGAILMLMTEVLYSARKRWRIFKAGQVRYWLSFHIFTGIVGPALVLMHSGMAFKGLAGLTTLLTAIVVLSGFVGRYIYTAVPRTLAGIEVDRRSLEVEEAKRRRELVAWSEDKSAHVRSLIAAEIALTEALPSASPAAIFTRKLREVQQRRRLRQAIGRLQQAEQARMKSIENLIRQQQRMARQISSLQTVRSMMGLWHTLHVPIGLTLFVAMFIHIAAAIYYSGIGS